MAKVTFGDVLGAVDKGIDGYLTFSRGQLESDRVQAEIAALNRQSLILPTLAPEPAILGTLNPQAVLPEPTRAAPVSDVQLLDAATLDALLENDRAIASQLVTLDHKTVTATDRLRADELGGGMSTEMMVAIGLALLVLAAGAR